MEKGVNRQASINNQNNNNQNVDDYKTQSNLKDYKRKLLIKIIALIFVCVFLVLERIFFNYLKNQELDLIKNMQKGLGSGLGIDWNGPNNGLFNFFGGIGDFKYIFLYCTHIYISLYFGLDVLISLKLMYLHYIGIFLLAIITLGYGEPRPFWEDFGVVTQYCYNTFGHPSHFIFTFLFLGSYFYLLYKRSLDEIVIDVDEGGDEDEGDSVSGSRVDRKSLVVKIMEAVFIIFILITSFFRYLLGMTLLINIVIGILYFSFYFSIVMFSEAYIDKLIKNSTIIKIEAKKYIFYWLIYLLLIESFAFIIFLMSDDEIKIDWIENYLRCTNNDESKYNIPYNQLIGVYPTFQQTSILFAVIGAVFGSAICFQLIPNIHWFLGSWKKRAKRVALANLFMIPSWLLIIYQQKMVNQWQFGKLGLNDYLFNVFHFFFLYFGVFGFLPWIFHKMKLTHIDLKYSFLNRRDH